MDTSSLFAITIPQWLMASSQKRRLSGVSQNIGHSRQETKDSKRSGLREKTIDEWMRKHVSGLPMLTLQLLVWAVVIMASYAGRSHWR